MFTSPGQQGAGARRRSVLAAACLSVVVLVGCETPPPPAPVAPGTFVFPLARAVSVTDTFGAPRSGGRSHQGQDLMAPKMTVAVAAFDGTITQVKHSNSGNAGNQLRLTGDNGWHYYYMHLNNDTPGTDDGVNRYDQAFADGIRVGQRVLAGEPVGYVGDSGNAENTGAHLHFEAHDPNVGVVNAFELLRTAPVAPVDTTNTRPIGSLDSVVVSAPNTLSVSGWALDPRYETSVPVTVFVNGNPSVSGVADRSRPDVSAVYTNYTPNRGYSVTVPGIVAGTHNVCVVLHNPTTGGGGRTTCASVAVG